MRRDALNELISLNIYYILFCNSVFLDNPCEILFGLTDPIFIKLVLASLLHGKGKANWGLDTKSKTPCLVPLAKCRSWGLSERPSSGGSQRSVSLANSQVILRPSWAPDCKLALEMLEGDHKLGIWRLVKKGCHFYFILVKTLTKASSILYPEENMVLDL